MLKDKPIIPFVIACVLVFIVFASAISIYFFPNKTGPAPKPIPLPSSFEKNYNNFNYLIPGKSTYEDVVKLNGAPYSSKEEGGKTILLYRTPNSTYDNTVVLENNVVEYAIEYVYSSYRGLYSDYLKKLGNPDLSLYLDNPDQPSWFVFLSKGVAIESSNDEITRIVYFIPQSKEQFMNGVGKLLNLKDTPPAIQGEPL